MTPGVRLVKAHFDSMLSGQWEEFDAQLSPTFRYAFLPPVMGEGPPQAKRWSALLLSIYRTWSFDIIEAHESKEGVTLRIEWFGTNPTDGDTPAVFHDTTMFMFTLSEGRLATCNATYLDFEEHPEFGASATT